MRNSLIKELIDRAECYFADELIWTKKQHNNTLFFFKSSRYTEQFIDEVNTVKERGAVGPLKFRELNLEIQEDKRYLKVS